MLTRSFCDFEELAVGIRAWDLDFRQLDAGDSGAQLAQIGYGDIQLTEVRFGRRYDQRGSAPPGTRTFALLEPGVTGVVWCGRPVADRTLCMFDAAGSFEAVSQPGFSVLTLAVPERQVAEITASLGLRGSQAIINRADVGIGLPVSAARDLYGRMARLKQAAVARPEMLERPEFIAEFTRVLPAEFIRAAATGRETQERPDLRPRHRALKMALERIHDSPGAVINVSDLCLVTGVSERTLEYAFLERFGIPPKRYLLRVRLNAVRKRLIRGTPGELAVTDAANHLGFWHMGQFAADYRRLFGELPSDTLRKK